MKKAKNLNAGANNEPVIKASIEAKNEDSTVTASGTSEGVRKSWESRKGNDMAVGHPDRWQNHNYANDINEEGKYQPGRSKMQYVASRSDVIHHDLTPEKAEQAVKEHNSQLEAPHHKEGDVFEQDGQKWKIHRTDTPDKHDLEDRPNVADAMRKSGQKATHYVTKEKGNVIHMMTEFNNGKTSKPSSLGFSIESQKTTKASEFDLTHVIKCADTDISLNDLRDQISAMANDDERFNQPQEQDGKAIPCSSVWVSDIEKEGDQWFAIVQAANGKLYRLGFEVGEDGSVDLKEDGQKEVVRKTQYVNASWHDLFFNGEVIKAKNSSVTGKPSLHTHIRKMHDAIDKAAKGNDKFGVNTDQGMRPYTVDVLMPDDDGQHHAVIRKTDGKLVKVPFNFHADSDTAEFVGDPVDTECTPVYSSTMAEYDAEQKIVNAKGTTPGGLSARATSKVAHSKTASMAADVATNKAMTSNKPEDHKEAATAHRAASDAHLEAMTAQVKSGANKATVKIHTDAVTRHAIAADDHEKFDGDGVRAKIRGGVYDPNNSDGKGAVGATDTKKDPLIHCNASRVLDTKKNWSLDKAVEFMWMPSGVTSVSAGYEGRAIHLTVECDESTAKAVDASFSKWRAEVPKQRPFICIEHREQESAGFPIGFGWKDGEEGGVFCSVEPSALGVENVNGKVHRSFSPSFTTDAEYHKCKCSDCKKSVETCKCGGALEFPEGVRGSEGKPAKVTGIGFSVGSLTNKPAFRNISPVKAREGGTAPVLGAEPKKPSIQEVFSRLTPSAAVLAVTSEKKEKINTIFARLNKPVEQANPPVKDNNGATNK